MMKVLVQLHSEACLVPKSALIIYGDENRHMASVNDILELPGGGTETGPGRPLTYEELGVLVRQMSRVSTVRTVFPENLLYADPEVMCWWKPAHHRSLFFTTRGSSTLDALSGRMALQPNLVFIAEPKALKVYAIARSERPTMGTKLLLAPYMNIYGNGALCVGSAPIPDHPAPTQECMDAYENALFDAAFTHSNFGNREMVNYTGGHSGLWQSMVETGHKFFPAWALRPLPPPLGPDFTLAKALEGSK